MSELKYLTKKQVESFIESFADGAIFSVVFAKKDGTLRRMVCRQGVTAHLKGGVGTYNANDADNIGVFDTEVKNLDGTFGAYRCFNAHRVLRIKGGGAKIEACDVGEIEEPIVNAHGEQVKVK